VEINPYEVLGLDAAASAEEIHARRTALLKMLHPDRQQSDEERRAAEAQSKRINAAYDFLRDPARRAAYDRTHRAASSASRPPHPSFQPSHLDFGALRPGVQKVLTLRVQNDGGPATSAQIDLSVAVLGLR
jgi:curved DNA-binding protein CbpA